MVCVSTTIRFNGLCSKCKAVAQAEQIGAQYHVGNILSSDVFYNDNSAANEGWQKMGYIFFSKLTAVLSAISIICVKEFCRSCAVVSSPVTKLSDTVRIASAFFLHLAAFMYKATKRYSLNGGTEWDLLKV